VSPAAARAVIEQRIESQWGATTVIAWPNVPFTPPATASWLKVDFIWGQGSVMTKGAGGLDLVTGVLQLAIFSPKDTGDGASDALAESARAMVNRFRFGSPNESVMFGAASGPVKQFEESWRSVIVSAPFRVHEAVP
jgi:Bacteriophage related domain of unknown function